ncbi:MAG: KpsF/GutQ family sugar-phosphate isomerase [Desulfatitalea sp.]|nr:KpsF/GutQ family sugar-phosphate isomerase [Desulfatitalea sp.]NNK01667.1 KpsF/GutQ family sugar-phosphate isomerase [Desulfatitalea sp.]
MNQLSKKRILEEAISVLKLESESIMQMSKRMDDSFAAMVEMICNCPGRVIIGGIGKSGIIARKITATLNSTGTRAIFLHPVEAMHGDLGMVSGDDIFLALSSSGETDELNILLPRIQSVGCPIIGFTGNKQSTLARHSDIVIDVAVEKEACPLGLAPTCSTTAMLAMGDALAVVLINQKKFKSDDFKRFHPGGALGQRLARQVGDIMLTGDDVPVIATGEQMNSAIAEMNRHSLGVILITDRSGGLAGIITDGDIRRTLAKNLPLNTLSVDDIMSTTPHNAQPDMPAYDALNLMERHEITTLPIIDENKKVKGILHLHDILGKGEFKFNGS